MAMALAWVVPPSRRTRGVVEAWLSIIGIGEDRAQALPPASRAALETATHVFGAPRHLRLAGVEDDPRARAWPVPFSVEPLLALRGAKVAMLISGDPFWFGGGSSIARHLAPDEWRAFPRLPPLAGRRRGWAGLWRTRPVLASTQRHSRGWCR
jgi:precorrin-6Y C5,15-methyltransferase (decarboxylating)